MDGGEPRPLLEQPGIAVPAEALWERVEVCLVDCVVDGEEGRRRMALCECVYRHRGFVVPDRREATGDVAEVAVRVEHVAALRLELDVGEDDGDCGRQIARG